MALATARGTAVHHEADPGPAADNTEINVHVADPFLG